MGKRKLVVLLSQFDLTSSKIMQICNFLEEDISIKAFKKAKFPENILKKDTFNQILVNADEKMIDTYLKNLEDREIYVTTIFDRDYPEKLMGLKDAPAILYYMGDLSLTNTQALSVVGTRKPTNYGRITTQKLVGEIALAGVTIVSGLAYGVDAIAHKTTLENGGKTIAVLGSGFDHIYPSEHTSLAKEIAGKGLLLSEQRPKKAVSKYLFPLRNRIIAGLGEGALITEAGLKSGTIHTKEFALEYGKNLYAVPGNIDSENSQLTNDVIRSGQGRCVLSAKDILEDYDIKEIKKEDKTKSLLGFSKDEQKIVDALQGGMKSIEEVTKNLNMDINFFNSCLTMLEIRGIINRLPGGQIALI